ncbi:MAG: NACHT domain-containing protein, partial [Acidobacteriota bacterium]
PQQQLDEIIFILKPPKGVIPPSSASQGDRTAALLSWAEGTGGCGLDDIRAALDLILTNENGIAAAVTVPATSSTQTQLQLTTNLSNQSQAGNIVNVAQGTVIINHQSGVNSNTSGVSQLAMLNGDKEEVDKYSQIEDSDCVVTRLFKECFRTFANAGEWVKESTIQQDFLGKAGKVYTDTLERRYGTIRIMGMSEPVPLRNIYTSMNILEKITAQQRISYDDLEQYFDRDNRVRKIKYETKEAVQVVNARSKLVVLGKPGSGKTTFLKYITLQMTNGMLKTERIPVFLSSKDWADSNRNLNLLNYIVGQFNVCHFPETKPFVEHLLKEGKCLILIDGLDEVGTGKESEIVKEVRKFSDSYSDNHFILSSRIAAYNYCFEKFTDVEMANLDDSQIERFISNWFNSNTTKAWLCWKELRANPPIKELASLPLLLTMLCLAFDQTMCFPKNRSELYKDSVDALLRTWDASKNVLREQSYKNLSRNRKESLFSHILDDQVFKFGKRYNGCITRRIM